MLRSHADSSEGWSGNSLKWQWIETAMARTGAYAVLGSVQTLNTRTGR